MQFGELNNLILFGGGQRLVNFLSVAKDFSAIVFSSPRFLQAPLDDEPCTVEEYFKKEGIAYLNITRIADVDIHAYVNNKTLGISFGAPWIFKQDFLDVFEGRIINGHGTRLPKNRGGASFSWQIMRQDRTGCHLFHLIDGGIDTGDIVAMRPYEFPMDCRTPKAYKDYHQQTELAFYEDVVLKLKQNFDFPLQKQDETVSTYYPRLSTERHGWIDWSWCAQDIERFICAFDEPFMGASTWLDGQRVFLKSVRVDLSEGAFHPFMSGLVYRVTPERIFVAANDASLTVESLTNGQGGDWKRHAKIGSRFVTSATMLDEARAFRAIYTPVGLKEAPHES